MPDHHCGVDAAAYIEAALHPHEARAAGGDQIIQQAVCDRFVKGALIPERCDVELERFQLDALLVRDVIQINGGEVGLSGLRTQAGEFGNFDMDRVVAVRLRIAEGFDGRLRHRCAL